jgi:hypothetical protein
MIKLKDLQPDQALKDLLDGKIKIAISDNESRIANVYKQGVRPNTDLGSEFIDILHNGVIRSMIKPFGFYRGNLAITLYCEAQSNGTARFNRINSMLSQVVTLCNNNVSGKFFFEIDANNSITPIASNSANGFSTMTLNIAWHTTE